MYKTAFIAAIVGLVATGALAQATITRTGPNGGVMTGEATRTADGFMRTQTRSNAYGGSSSTTRSCTAALGCSRDWSAMSAGGLTASGSSSARPGDGIMRSGTGFRGRSWQISR